MTNHEKNKKLGLGESKCQESEKSEWYEKLRGSSDKITRRLGPSGKQENRWQNKRME